MTWNGIDDAQRYADDLLAGERVRLRGLADDDLPMLEEWWYDPRVQVFQTGLMSAGLQAGTAKHFRQWSENLGPTSVGLCIERLMDGALVGHVSLFGSNAKDRAATFGIIVGPPFQGSGLGSEATRLMVAYGFRELGLHRIGLQVYAYNDRAIATYRRAGFVEEGRTREFVFHDSAFHDEVHMGILAREWRAAHDTDAKGQ